MHAKCPHCLASQSSSPYTCENCGIELVENGALVDALTYWNANKASDNASYHLIPLGLTAIAGAAAAWLNTSLIAIAGAVAAAVFFFARSYK
ncbi:hypothetical protein [Paenibacillus piri]|uniref:Uncharacterized protein n=1 Tax=Paenibacillus piri TaxID=2547395 RepID=A0A4R5KSM2_9BACL|nr:hypothetical protein [Paenibacillus piri]TDF98048.1 hypothetical protein E1757_11095 [Paenibacillus piri]